MGTGDIEVTAQAKRECPSCGAEAIWSPSKGCLVCPYCGTSVPITENEGTVEEHDLVTALRSIPDEARGWQAEKVSVKCRHCEAISVFDPGTQGQRCTFCGSSQLVPFEETKQPFRPESLLPFKIAENEIRDSLRAWYGKRWFAPNNLGRISSTDILKGVYLPFWTFDAHVEADWTAEAGYYYYTTETYTDSQGNSRTRQVQHIRWEDAAGHVSHDFDDVLVSASKGVPADLVDSVGPFPTSELVPYDSSYVSGWVVEHYQLDLVQAAAESRGRMEREVQAKCASDVPGDTHRALSVESEFSDLTFKHILAPVWVVTYTYGSRSYQVLANGVTGTIVGQYPKSWIKITLAVLFAIIIVTIIVALQSQR
jgi:hypothetical protein